MAFKIGPISIGGKGLISFRPDKMNLMDIVSTAGMFIPGGQLTGNLAKMSTGNLGANLGLNSMNSALNMLGKGNILGALGSPGFSQIAGILSSLGGGGGAGGAGSYSNPTISALVKLLSNEALDENTRNAAMRMLHNEYIKQAIALNDPANMPEERNKFENRAVTRGQVASDQQVRRLRSEGYGDSLNTGLHLASENNARTAVNDWDANSRDTEDNRLNRLLELTRTNPEVMDLLMKALGFNQDYATGGINNERNRPSTQAEALAEMLGSAFGVGSFGAGTTGVNHSTGQPWLTIKQSNPYATLPLMPTLGSQLPNYSSRFSTPAPMSNSQSLAKLTLGNKLKNTGLSIGTYNTGLSGSGVLGRNR